MFNNIFDSHAHYDDERFDDDRYELLNSFSQKGVAQVINVGCNIKRSQLSLELADKYDFVYCSVGIHPSDAQEADEKGMEQIEQMAKSSKVVAIGEIGLDYHYEGPSKEVQKQAFEKQMELAQKLKMPVIIHSREATADTLEILKKFPQVKGVVHCFSGSLETAKLLLKMGYYISFTGVVTFSNAKKSLEVAKYVPTDRLLLETDCPYMAPTPHRGKRCDSAMIEFIAEKIASEKQMDTQELINMCTENSKKIFNIK